MDTLPLEIKRHILELLDDKSRLRSRLTCTEWFKLVNYDDFTILFCNSKILAAVIERMSKYSHPIGLTFGKSRFNLGWDPQPSDQDIDQFFELSRLTHLTKLEIPDQYFDWDLWDPFTTLTNLRNIVIQDHYGAIRGMLQTWLNLTKLTGNEDLLDKLNFFTNLRSLDISVAINDAEVIERLKFPEKLTSLVFFSSRGQGTLNLASVTLLTGLKTLDWNAKSQVFPHHLLPNLESLDVQGSSPDRLDMNTNLTTLILKDPAAVSDQFTKLKKLKVLSILYQKDVPTPAEYLTALTGLENLVISLFNGTARVDQICPFITSSRLTELYFSCNNVEFSQEISRLVSLQSLEIRALSVNTGWLTHLTNLTLLVCGESNEYEEYLYTLTKLKTLVVHRRPTIVSTDSLNLADLTNLEELSFKAQNSEPYSILGLEQLTKLTNLFIEEDLDASVVKRLTQLQYLYSHSRSDEFFEIVSALTNLNYLVVEAINNEQVLQLTSLTRLTWLGFRGDHVSKEFITQHYSHLYKLAYYA